MKSKLPRSVKFDSATEARLTRLLGGLDKSAGIRCPALLNVAITQLLDRLDSGAVIILDGKNLRVAKVSEHTDSDQPFVTLAEHITPHGAKRAAK